MACCQVPWSRLKLMDACNTALLDFPCRYAQSYSLALRCLCPRCRDYFSHGLEHALRSLATHEPRGYNAARYVGFDLALLLAHPPELGGHARLPLRGLVPRKPLHCVSEGEAVARVYFLLLLVAPRHFLLAHQEATLFSRNSSTPWRFTHSRGRV
mgnify:CR=1 FL=1